MIYVLGLTPRVNHWSFFYNIQFNGHNAGSSQTTTSKNEMLSLTIGYIKIKAKTAVTAAKHQGLT